LRNKDRLRCKTSHTGYLHTFQGLRDANGESVDSNGYVTPELLGSSVNKKIYELPTHEFVNALQFKMVEMITTKAIANKLG
jgi:hypothetical protein